MSKLRKKLGPISDPLSAILSSITYEEEFRILRIMNTDLEDLEINLALGQNLKHLRKNFKISQHTMGLLLRVHQSAVSRIEKGEQTLSPAQFFVLETLFKLPYSELIKEGRIDRVVKKPEEN